jgi:hypothetical protein
VPFLWFVSLGKQRNEHTDFMVRPPQFPDEPFLPCPAAIARGPERKISLSHKKLVRSPPYSYTIDSAILSLFRKRQTQATPTTANEKNDGDSNLSHMRPAPSKS